MKYSRELKLTIYKYYKSGDNHKEIAEHFNIPVKYIRFWISEIEKKGEKAFPGKTGPPPSGQGIKKQVRLPVWFKVPKNTNISSILEECIDYAKENSKEISEKIDKIINQ